MPSLIPQLMQPQFRSREVRTSRCPRDRVLPMWHSERRYATCVEMARAGATHQPVQLMFLIEISMLTVSGMGILVTERSAVWSLAVEMSISSRRLWMRISQWS